MFKADLVERAAAEIIDCAYTPDGWTAALDTMALATGSSGVTIDPLQQTVSGYWANEPARMLTEAYYAEGWHLTNSSDIALPRLRRMGLVLDHEYQPWDVLKDAAHIKDFLRPRGFLHFATSYIHCEGKEWRACFLRSVKDGHFDAPEQSTLRRLLAPLNNSAKINVAVSRAYSSSFMQLNLPLLLLDHAGRVGMMNQKAEELLEDVFSVRDGRISDPDSRAIPTIQDYVDRALSLGALEDLAPFVYRRENVFAVFDVCRLQPPASGPFSPFHAMVTITMPSRSTPDPARAQRLFSLTRRETDLVIALCRNHGLTSAAKSLDMKHETARMHLKSIFMKTRTSSQSELMATLGATSRRPFLA